jgi:hypothetical protein
MAGQNRIPHLQQVVVGKLASCPELRPGLGKVSGAAKFPAPSLAIFVVTDHRTVGAVPLMALHREAL